MFPIQLDIKRFKMFFNNFICFIINPDFYAITFECITRSSSLSLEEIKVIAIVNGIFHVSDFSRLFIMSFKYGLTILRYSSADRVLFLSLLISYSIQLLLQKLLTLTGLNNLLLHTEEGS